MADKDYITNVVWAASQRLAYLLERAPDTLKMPLLDVQMSLLGALSATDPRYLNEAAGVSIEEWASSLNLAEIPRLDPTQIGKDAIRIFRDHGVTPAVVLEALPVLIKHWIESRTGVFEADNAGYAVAVSMRERYVKLLKLVVTALAPEIKLNFDAPGLPAKHEEAVAVIAALLTETQTAITSASHMEHA